ncbi:MAG: glycosyltransferase family 4 protein [Patescibacteria group bacterium]|nr:glycosyltransferase family 4 protein [Patescibacteria group bacterium]
MKILMLVPFLPNIKTSGGQTRWYNIIKYLSKSHEITLFSLIKDESERQFIPELKKYCRKVKVFKRPKSPWTFRNIFLTGITWFPFLVIRNFSLEEKNAIKKELERERYDLIHAETFYVMPHIPKTSVPSILVEQTIEYQVYMHYVINEAPWFLKPLFLIDVMKLRFWEKYFWKKADGLVAVSREDKLIMQKLIPKADVDIIPNGVDFEYYCAKKVEKKFPPRVLYGVTNFEWLQNLEAVNILIKEVWPHIKKGFPTAILWIVGRKIPYDLLQLSKEKQDIKITESIADSRDAYLGASVMLTPIRGSGGTRLKVLEAMAAGLPVVSTSVGVAGLDVKHGKHALISDDTKELARFTVELLKDKDKARIIGKNGKDYVRKFFDWQSIVKMHDKIYKKAISKKYE